MASFSLSNRFFQRAIDREQFIAYAQAFTRAVSNDLGSDCEAKFDGYATIPFNLGMDDPAQDAALQLRNERYIIFKGADPADISQNMWDGAAFIKGDIVFSQKTPEDLRWAKMAVKGRFPRMATFYVQPRGDNVRSSMREAFPRAILGEGFPSNSYTDGIVCYGLDASDSYQSLNSAMTIR